MFAIDDFVLWFAWYFAEDLALHPSTAKLMEKAGIAISGDPPPAVVEHPEATLDWLADPKQRTPPRPALGRDVEHRSVTGSEGRGAAVDASPQSIHPTPPHPPNLSRVTR